MAEDKYNCKNPAVKRILQELKELRTNPSDEFMSLPLEENIFEWQFAILGPRDSEFEGGIYHGRIQLPADYPFKPPSFMLLTPNGRFETQTKICLSISNHHPEHWQPSWSVRTALLALIAFMPTNPDGALGSLDYTKVERKTLAIKSREEAPRFGNPERQKLIDEIHQYLLGKVPPVPQLIEDTLGEGSSLEDTHEVPISSDVAAPTQEPHAPEPDGAVEDVREVHVNAAAGSVRLSFSAGVRLTRRAPAELLNEQPVEHDSRVQKPSIDDRMFTFAAIGLAIAILVLVAKKLLRSYGLDG
ncbi:ubiquitin-conjugating enzyme E2 32-like [Zingiber officinale]|uniref:UBC core domain-containing protein n=1 Tax=Zingiber officinale TaxID=94328 RepID=A0A8J5LES2_ZINOF|nr:ubiquitin-conjugating enzyme E2 32-like [Zingiber officinale]KAG6515986.1 hypothetical protein ZIOFF_026432 [Zingiber officinale]